MGIVVSREEALWLRSRHAAQRIVSACGCFDILHIGHLEYLEGAAKWGRVLFVGVNSDASIERNKGKPPYFSLQDRMRMIAALTCVDYVFPFSERTFSLSLFLLRPSVLARGVDAAVKVFPEKRAAASLGIEVKRIGREKRASSSKLRDILRQGPATKT